MSLQVPSYAAPQFAAPIANAYLWCVGVQTSFVDGSGYVSLWVHPDAASAAELKPPIDQPRIALGQSFATADGGSVHFPTFSELDAAAKAIQAANTALSPFQALREAVYAALLTLPAFQGSTQVE